MTVVFWAEAAGDERTASEAERLLSGAIAEPPADAQAASAVARTLESIARGEPLADATLELPAGTRLHILGLAANVGRLSVRLWHVDTLGALARRIVEHWDDLRIEPSPWPEPPAARRLLYETARQRKADRIPPALGPALLRAILGGGRYPRTLLAAVIARIRADKAVTGAQAAICRACLARDHRLGFEQEDAPVSLDRDETHPAYRLGRLFAVYERVQRAALGAVNAGIRDRFYGAASSTPGHGVSAARSQVRESRHVAAQEGEKPRSCPLVRARDRRDSRRDGHRVPEEASGSRTRGGSRSAITTSAPGSVIPGRPQTSAADRLRER